MAKQQILYWRDIPAEIIIREGRSRTRAPLAPRFMEAIDMAAMRAGAKDSDAYLEGWRQEVFGDADGDLEAAAEAAASALEADYPADRLARLISSGGHDHGPE